LNEKDPDKFIAIVKALQPTFGGVNLEDISHPKCFHILDTLRKECEIPVWHDDQQGTACVTVAGLINALKIVGKKMSEVHVTIVGAGASGIAISRLMITAGITPGNMLNVDSKGILHRDRSDRDILQARFKEKWDLCLKTNEKQVKGDVPDAIKGADVLISVSTPGPGTIRKQWIKTMAKDAIVFACANPVPEIWPWEAKEAGARIVATGRSDFPNQVNNSLGFPGIFRGALDVRATTITDEMCIAASNELAKVAQDHGISEDYIIPTMDEWEVFPREAVAVGSKGIEQGVAKKKSPAGERFKVAETIIKEARAQVQMLMKENFIIDPDL
jgi:malate dehydrogenase (oxaloacetate-decarboxylating)